MNKKWMVALSLALSFAVSGVHAQNVNAGSTSDNTNNSQSTAANQGVNAINNFNTTTPTDTSLHEHISGITGSNTAVGLGSFSSSFSSDYCGGTAQAGISAPYVTLAAGGPVLKEPGIACVNTRAAVHTMEFSATYGNAAAAASKAGNSALADTYAKMSGKLAQASVNMLCNLSDDVRQAYRDAGVMCPETKAEKEAAAKQQAIANNEPTDPFVRARMGLPALASSK